MTADEEKIDPASCLNRAEPDEIVFILLARDAAMPATIRFWCEERQRLGLDWDDSPTLIEARKAAHAAEMQRAEIRKRLGKPV